MSCERGRRWGGDRRRLCSVCDRDLDPNQNGDLGANHRAPWSPLSCGPRRELQKHKTLPRSPLSLAIRAEVKAFIWTGSLFASSHRSTAFHHTSERLRSFVMNEKTHQKLLGAFREARPFTSVLHSLENTENWVLTCPCFPLVFRFYQAEKTGCERRHSSVCNNPFYA